MGDSTSPRSRSLSPSPSLEPFPALGACPMLDRSVSTPSTVSSRSVSSSSTHSEAGLTNRRKNGYMRPQGTNFADSARHRDSVMNLGSIAHMQYYFARTGLLDGKGAQMARSAKKPATKNVTVYTTTEDGLAGSPLETSQEWCEPVMLPPTVSTYCHKEPEVEPLPELPVLRRQLREALDDARHVLQEPPEEASLDLTTRQAIVDSISIPTDTQEPPFVHDWHEIMGLHLLDIITLAIRAAKTYYTTHPRPHNLYAIQSERQIRSDLYQVLDMLKRMAAREFRGGIKDEEREGIASWIDGIQDLLSKEESKEREEKALRDSCTWRSGDWSGREREREQLFLSSFDTNPEPLPAWTEPTGDEPSPFLKTLQSGLRLVRLHNEMVSRSERPFGEIRSYFTDLAKPYRCAENLRFWAKAAELRWETKLIINSLDIVNGKDAETWRNFDETVLKWCQGVREEISKEWTDAEKSFDEDSQPRHHSDNRAVSTS